MIQHCVFCRLAPGHDGAELAAVMDGLAALVGEIPGFTAFSHGPNIDMEGKSPGWSYGFVGSYSGRAALAAYAEDPRHRALGARLVALSAGGGEGIMVFDIEAEG